MRETILLVSDYGADVEGWRAALAPYNARLDLRVWPEIGDAADVDAILIDTTKSNKGGYSQYPRLKWVAYLGAGVGDVIGDPTLPINVTVTRLTDAQLACSMALSALSSTLSHHQRALEYRDRQQNRIWARIRTTPIAEFRVGVLGLGYIGAQVAKAVKDVGFSVTGWSRTPKTIEGINATTGLKGLNRTISESEFIISILPDTAATQNLFNAALFDKFMSGAAFANLGRGSLVNERDLLEAIRLGRVHSAYLDVFQKEPLPPHSPLWKSDRVVITPHAGGGLGTSRDSKAQVAANYGRFIKGETLQGVVDRARGY